MSKHSDHPSGPNGNILHHGHIPYWKRAHTDWRFWIGVMLMFVAMIVYIMTGDLALRPRLGPQLPLPGGVVK
jgi:hypothetical protein